MCAMEAHLGRFYVPKRRSWPGSVFNFLPSRDKTMLTWLFLGTLHRRLTYKRRLRCDTRYAPTLIGCGACIQQGLCGQAPMM